MDALETYRHSRTADQYRARAEFVRCTAAKMTSDEKRQQLLDIAEEYEWLVERIGRARFGSVDHS